MIPRRPAADRPGLARAVGQPERVIRLFWQPVLESALGESIDLVDIAAARKVAVDGFLAHPEAADLFVPTEPLGRLFGERLVAWLEGRGVTVETGRAISGLERDASGAVAAVVADRRPLPCEAVILAVPWRAAARLAPDLVPPADERLAGSPITAVHLWFDRDCIDLPHAVLLGRVSHWVFRPADAPPGYCQVVISGSRDLLGGDRERLRETVVAELREAFPAAREAAVVDARIVTDPTAVLSVRPGVDAVRPPAATAVPNLFLAGDWTATGWPSTMEAPSAAAAPPPRPSPRGSASPAPACRPTCPAADWSAGWPARRSCSVGREFGPGLVPASLVIRFRRNRAPEERASPRARSRHFGARSLRDRIGLEPGHSVTGAGLEPGHCVTDRCRRRAAVRSRSGPGHGPPAGHSSAEPVRGGREVGEQPGQPRCQRLAVDDGPFPQLPEIDRRPWPAAEHAEHRADPSAGRLRLDEPAEVGGSASSAASETTRSPWQASPSARATRATARVSMSTRAAPVAVASDRFSATVRTIRSTVTSVGPGAPSPPRGTGSAAGSGPRTAVGRTRLPRAIPWSRPPAKPAEMISRGRWPAIRRVVARPARWLPTPPTHQATFVSASSASRPSRNASPSVRVSV